MPKLVRMDIIRFKGLEDICLKNIGQCEIFFGKNNSGKSSILHAIDIVGVASNFNEISRFVLKLDIADLFSGASDSKIEMLFDDDSYINMSVGKNGKFNIVQSFSPGDFSTLLYHPVSLDRYTSRPVQTPNNVMKWLKGRTNADYSGLDIFYAFKAHAELKKDGYSTIQYKKLLKSIKSFFPEIEKIESSLTLDNVSTVRYRDSQTEKDLDILYSGSGLKQVVDLLVRLEVIKPDILLMDEPESGLHPSLQRQMMKFLAKYSKEKKMQVVIATHSPTIINFDDSNFINLRRCYFKEGQRNVEVVKNIDSDILLFDLGIKPSDFLQSEITLMVEGKTDVIFWDHILNSICSDKFSEISISIFQYGGGAAKGIFDGSISLENIAAYKPRTLWIIDRDASPDEKPDKDNEKLAKIIIDQKMAAHVTDKRELEFYYPEALLVKAQQGDKNNEKAVSKILTGNQTQKFQDADDDASKSICIPSGKYLKKLLIENVTMIEQLDSEINEIVDNLLEWAKEILEKAK